MILPVVSWGIHNGFHQGLQQSYEIFYLLSRNSLNVNKLLYSSRFLDFKFSLYFSVSSLMVINSFFYHFILFSYMIFSKVLPFWFISLYPHMMKWLLKSPIKINGLESCCNSSSSSVSIIWSHGGMYIEHIVMVRCRVAVASTAWRFVLSSILHWEILLLIRMDVPPKVLSILLFI